MSQSSNESPVSETPTMESEDFIMVDGALPIRTKSTPVDDDIKLQVHSVPSDGAFLVSCQPPIQPKDDIRHAPCDIVLVIDVSGSMNTAAPLPDTGDASKEDTGLSILDLVKHSSRTILENLSDSDRLGIVTFSDDAKVIQELTLMSETEKKETRQRIETLYDNGCTNLWSGIRAGLKLFEEAEFTKNIQGLYILTDGKPNHMCPKQGYVNKLKPMLATMAEAKTGADATMPTIHTFGFGYSIRSDLLQSIAEVGNGNFAFIPDAGMIGTVFVHAVANLFSSFGINSVLEVETNPKVDFFCSTVFNSDTTSTTTQFQLGNIQHGQSRDLVIKCDQSQSQRPSIKATLTYRDRSGKSYSVSANSSQSTTSGKLPEHVFAYHSFRSQLCNHISAFFPTSASTNEHEALTDCTKEDGRWASARSSLEGFVSEIRSSPYASDPKVASIIQDLTAVEGESHGQVSKALLATGDKQYYTKWGKHYLPSLLHAHARQVCNSFKDPGPLMYGRDSPLFTKCKAELDEAFDNLPAPKPSRHPVRGGTRNNAPVNMSRYHKSSNPCFAGSCPVLLSGGTSIQISKLKPGDAVHTSVGARSVAAVFRTDPTADVRSRGQLCRIDSMWVTPWHPCLIDGKWSFPATVAKEVKKCNEPVFSVMLERCNDPNAHTIMVAGVMGVTLGHGVVGTVDEKDDVRVHPFFGDYDLVARSLEQLTMDGEGHLQCGGITRDDNGLACGFVPAKVVDATSTNAVSVIGNGPAQEWPSIPTVVVAAAA